MQHVEFFDTDHFEKNYHRVNPPPTLAHFIDFFWETKFEPLWEKYPNGFSDALFPNIGYTYLINLGTPFTMQVGETSTLMKSDGFLPRHLPIECHHQAGNILFGIKFRISPVIFEKKINFAEYRSGIYPLSYLLDKKIIAGIKAATGFDKRVEMLNAHFTTLLEKSDPENKAVHIVSEILYECSRTNQFNISIEQLASKYGITSRTLQRYFERATSLSSKKTLQILRIRKAVAELAKDPASFHYKNYGYYDYSHFYKHLKKFLLKSTLNHLQPHLALLSKLHPEND
jgi:AraC-like DNA-binding protein